MIAVPLTDLTFAIDLISEAEPEVVVIEQAIAASNDGSTLMDRLHSERYLRGIEVRLRMRVARTRRHASAGVARRPRARAAAASRAPRSADSCRRR